MVEQSERVSCPLRSRARLCATNSLWTTVAHVVFCLWAKHEGEQGYKTQKLKWNRILKTMKTVTAVTVCAFHTLFFDLWSFWRGSPIPVELCYCSLLFSGPLINQSTFGSRIRHPIPARRSQDLGGLHGSVSRVGENPSPLSDWKLYADGHICEAINPAYLELLL